MVGINFRSKGGLLHGDRRQRGLGAGEKDETVVRLFRKHRAKPFGPIPNSRLLSRPEPRAITKRRIAERGEQQPMQSGPPGYLGGRAFLSVDQILEDALLLQRIP